MHQPDDPWGIHRSIRLKREVLPHVVLEKLAHDCLCLAEAASGKEQLNWCVAAITFAALEVEAFLNVMGDNLVKKWDDIERNTNPSAKLAILENVLQFEFDLANSPFNAFKGLFDFRNLIVHAKRETLQVELAEKHNYAVPVSSGETPSPKWEKQATISNARTSVRDAREIVLQLAKYGNIQIPLGEHSRIQLNVEVPNDSDNSTDDQC